MFTCVCLSASCRRDGRTRRRGFAQESGHRPARPEQRRTPFHPDAIAAALLGGLTEDLAFQGIPRESVEPSPEYRGWLPSLLPLSLEWRCTPNSRAMPGKLKETSLYSRCCAMAPPGSVSAQHTERRNPIREDIALLTSRFLLLLFSPSRPILLHPLGHGPASRCRHVAAPPFPGAGRCAHVVRRRLASSPSEQVWKGTPNCRFFLPQFFKACFGAKSGQPLHLFTGQIGHISSKSQWVGHTGQFLVH